MLKKRLIIYATVMSLFLSFLGAFIPDKAYADSAFNFLSPKRKLIYKQASEKFWGDKGELNGVDCRPLQVTIESDHMGHNGAELAHADLWMAYNPPHLAPDGNRYGGNFCKLVYNLDEPESAKTACVTFMHEYGHLLGKPHNNNIQSPMYTGYERYAYGDPLGWKLYVRNTKNILGKSLCKTLKGPIS